MEKFEIVRPERYIDKIAATRIMLCYNSYKIRLRQERCRLNTNLTNINDKKTNDKDDKNDTRLKSDFVLMHPYPCQVLKQQQQHRDHDHHLSQSEKRIKIYEWETMIIKQFEQFFNEMVDVERLRRRWFQTNNELFGYGSYRNSWWKSRVNDTTINFVMATPRHRNHRGPFHLRQQWLKKHVATSTIAREYQRIGIALPSNLNFDYKNNHFDELCRLKKISKLEKNLIYDQLLDTKYHEFDNTFCIVDVSNVESCLRAETRMFLKCTDIRHNLRI